MHCVCFNVVCAAEEWTLTLVVLLPVILALRWYSKQTGSHPALPTL